MRADVDPLQLFAALEAIDTSDPVQAKAALDRVLATFGLSYVEVVELSAEGAAELVTQGLPPEDRPRPGCASAATTLRHTTHAVSASLANAATGAFPARPYDALGLAKLDALLPNAAPPPRPQVTWHAVTDVTDRDGQPRPGAWGRLDDGGGEDGKGTLLAVWRCSGSRDWAATVDGRPLMSDETGRPEIFPSETDAKSSTISIVTSPHYARLYSWRHSS
jgi:hypothetical protein